jgi:hypothetical protein
MLSIFLLTILSLTQLSSDTVDIKGTTGLFYQLFVNQNKLSFKYKVGRNWSPPTQLDSGDISEYVIAVTKGDYLHIAWCNAGKVCYQMNYKPILHSSLKKDKKLYWTEREFISPYFTEPASNISVKVSDKWVSVMWKSPNEQNNSEYEEIWQRKGLIRLGEPPRWHYPENKTITHFQEPIYPDSK